MSLSSYLQALSSTILIEIIVGLIFNIFLKLRTITLVYSLVLINLITHPFLTYSLWLINSKTRISITTPRILIAEVFVFLVEYFLLKLALPKKTRYLLLLSLVANLSSYLVGYLIF